MTETASAAPTTDTAEAPTIEPAPRTDLPRPDPGIAMAPVSIGLALFIMILEVLVAFIQAYIFTLLTSIFIGMYAQPAH